MCPHSFTSGRKEYTVNFFLRNLRENQTGSNCSHSISVIEATVEIVDFFFVANLTNWVLNCRSADRIL